MPNATVDHLFPTPLFKMQLAEAAQINPRLRAIILEQRAHDPGVSVSNAGGWHSVQDFFEWPQPEIKTLKAAMTRFVVDATQSLVESPIASRFTLALTGWANVSERGDYNMIHNHPGHHWSGCYYLDAGDPDPDCGSAGHIQFLDPRLGTNMLPIPGGLFGHRRMVFKPVEGALFLFPSWLDHMVLPHAGSRPRISIAFNALFHPLD